MNQNKILQPIYSMQNKSHTSPINTKSQYFNTHTTNNPMRTHPNFPSQLSLQPFIDKHSQQIMFGQVLRLVYIQQNGQIHIDQQSLQILQGFSTNEIGFVGLYGQRYSGKSFFYDNVLKLTHIEGDNFFRNIDVYDKHNNDGKYGYKEKQKQKGIYFYTIPYINNDDIKIFLLDCIGFNLSPLTSLQSQHQQMLLDIMLLLSSSIILLPSIHDKTGNLFNIFSQKLQQSTHRITQNNKKTQKSCQYWPQNLYCLYRNKSLINSDQTQQLQNMFMRFNYTLLNDAFKENNKKENMNGIKIIKSNSGNDQVNQIYLQQVSRLMKQVFGQIYVKKYYQLAMNGNICCKLLLELVKNFNNQINNSSHYKTSPLTHQLPTPISSIYLFLIHQLYQLSYQYHTQQYSSKLHSFLQQDHAYPLSYLITSFNTCQQQTFDSFRQLNINPILRDEYEQKLSKYIDQKQKYVIEINKKKTKYQLKKQIKQNFILPEQFNSNQEVIQIINKMKNVKNQLDHDRCDVFIKPLKEFSDVLSRKYYDSLKRKQQQKISQIKQRISLKKSILDKNVSQSLKNIALNTQYQQKFSALKQIDSQLTQKLKSHKKHLQIQKRSQKQTHSSKQATQSHAQQLLSLIRQLQQKQRQNKKIFQQINKDFQYNPKVQMLNKKIQEIKREMKSYQNSNIKGSQVGKNSQIRKINTGANNVAYIPSSK